MPKSTIDLAEVYQTVLRPVILDVARGLMRYTKFPKTARVQYNGSSPVAITTEAVLDNENLDPQFGADDKFTLTAHEEYHENSFLRRDVHRYTTSAIFSDNELGVNINPIYADSKITLTIECRAKDRSTVEQWRNGIYRRARMDQKEYMHDVDYHFPIPPLVIKSLRVIYDMREAQAGYGDTFENWLSACFNQKVTLISNLAGEQATYAVRESQSGVIGYFDFEAVPEIEKGSENGTWIANFTYTFRFDKPMCLVMHYPLMIHNQVLPRKYRDVLIDYNKSILTMPAGKANSAERQLLLSSAPHLSLTSGIVVPRYDDWIPKSVPHGTTSIIKAMLAISADDQQTLAGLDQLGPITLDPLVTDYIARNHDLVTLYGQSLFLITLYQGDYPMAETMITVGADLVVRATVPLDLRKNYHLRIAALSDLSLLADTRVDHIRENEGDVFELLVSALDPEVKMPERIGADRVIPRKEFWRCVRQIQSTNPMYRSPVDVLRHTVGQYLLQVSD